jgi:hypothetical protein
MIDVSATGAKLVLQAPAEVPDEFIVLLSKHASVRRKCKTAWRSGTNIGVQFDVEHPKKAAGSG